jgi:hypothetical protein
MAEAGFAIALLAIAGQLELVADDPEAVSALSGRLAKLATDSDLIAASGHPRVELPLELQLERFLSLDQAAALSGVSPDTWRRRYPDKIKRLSPRRVGIKLRDVIAIGTAA